MPYYRILTHAHSLWSYDGAQAVADLPRLLMPLGADVLLMTEHSQRFAADRMEEYREECRAASNRLLRIVPGIEYSTAKNEIHILTWGVDRYLGEELEVEQILDAVAEAGGVAVLAHPSRRDIWKKYDPAWSERLYGIELWNRKTDGLAPSRHAVRLLRDTGLNAIVSLDFHRKRQIYPLYNQLRTDQPIEGLSNTDLVSLIRRSRLRPMFAGLGVDGRDEAGAGAIHLACRGIEAMVEPLRSSRRRKRRPGQHP